MLLRSQLVNSVSSPLKEYVLWCRVDRGSTIIFSDNLFWCCKYRPSDLEEKQVHLMLVCLHRRKM